MQRPAKLFEAPEFGGGDLLFSLKEITPTPAAPKMNEPFTVKGKIDLLKIPFFGPLWVIATVVYPETWWESVIPIIGAPEVRATDIAIGGNFEIAFTKGFIREGEFSLSVRVYPGPTIPIDSLVLPPAPAAATFETTFIVAGEAPPEEELFRDFRIASYSKNGGTPVTPPGVLELEIGDRCRVNLALNHQGPAVTGKFHAAIWTPQPWDPHDEILFAEQSFSVPQSADWEPFEKSVDIIITSVISPGSDFGLYCKIMGITGADVFTEFLENVITITGVPVGGEFRNFGITWSPDPAILNHGDSLIVTHHFEYKGPKYTGADIRTAIGNRHYLPIIPDWFDEILYTIAHLEPFGPNEEWMGYDVDVDILITTALGPEIDYDLYSKLTDIPGADLYDYKDDIIEIVGAPPAGSIVSKYINKSPEGSRIPLPTTVKADNNTFEVGVTAKNTGTVVFTGGVEVKVYDPDGTLRASPTVDWTGIDPGETLRWEYNICRVDKAGSWAIKIRFLEKTTSAVLAETQTTMTATEVAVEYKGSIVSKYINKAPEGNKIPIPTEVKADNNTFEVGIRYKNYSGFTVTGGCKVEVRDPDGILRASPPVDWTGMSHNEELSKEYNICRVDKPGRWMVHIDFLMDSTVVDSYDGLLFTAVEEAPPVKEPPEIDTRRAENITHDSVTLRAELIEEGFCSGAYCYIEWGETISYGHKSPVERLQPGWKMKVDISGLEPDTKYYFRAVAEGRCVSPYLVDYSQARTFTTEEEVVVGFDLRVKGAPSNAHYWNCRIEWETGEEVELWPPIPIGSTWHYEGEVPSAKVDMHIGCYEKSTGGAYVKSQRWKWVFRLYAGRDYVYDFSDIYERWWEK